MNYFGRLITYNNYGLYIYIHNKKNNTAICNAFV